MIDYREILIDYIFNMPNLPVEFMVNEELAGESGYTHHEIESVKVCDIITRMEKVYTDVDYFINDLISDEVIDDEYADTHSYTQVINEFAEKHYDAIIIFTRAKQ